MQLYLVRRASEARKLFDFSNTNDIFSKRKDAERRLKDVQASSQGYFIETHECPSVYSDDLELHPQCNLEVNNKFCYWHHATDAFHKTFHRLVLDAETEVDDLAKKRIREHAAKYISALEGMFRYGPDAVSAPGYTVEACYLMALVEEFNRVAE
jgi:hypothetical protein